MAAVLRGAALVLALGAASGVGGADRSQLALELASFQARHGEAWALAADPRSGRPRRLAGGAIRWPPEKEGLPAAPGGEDALLIEKAGLFLQENASLLGLDPASLRLSPEGGVPAQAEWPTPICLGDFDGDGLAEIALPHRTRFMVFDQDGSTLWEVPVQDLSGASGCSVFDFDADGRPEILYRDERNLHLFDGRDGTLLWQRPLVSDTAAEVPVVADVDADGVAEIVVTGYRPEISESRYLHVFSHPSWPPARRVWNQENYSVTHVEEDGGIVPHPSPRWLGANDFRGQAIACPCGGPVASFSVTLPGCGMVALRDTFTACFEAEMTGGTAPVSLTWDFGDGSPAGTGSSPCHTYPGPGEYGVQLRVRDAVGCRSEAGQPVLLGEPLEVDFTAWRACAGRLRCLTASPQGGRPPYTFLWDFGDASPLETGQAPCHTFETGGAFPVTLFAEDAYGCPAEAGHPVEVEDPAALPEVSGPGSAAPLRVGRSGSDLLVTFEVTGFDTGIYTGDLGDLHASGYLHRSSGACRERRGRARLRMPGGNLYLLAVAAVCENPRAEGSYGTASSGQPRPSASDLRTPICP